jgi:tetratricopeptide (TPR) repeat protein
MKQSGPDSAVTVTAAESLAMAYVGAGRAKDAIAILEHVYQDRLNALGPAHIETLGTLDNLAFAYQAVGKMRNSLALFEKARDVAVPSLGAEDSLTLAILDSIVHLYRAFGRTEEAIALGEQVRSARIRKLGPYHPHTVHTLENLALAHMSAGKPEIALPLLEQAVSGLEQLKFHHGDAGRIVGNYCTCLEELDRRAQALNWRRRWLEIQRKRSGPESAAYAESLMDLGERLIDARSYSEAEPILRECVAISRKTRPDHWSTYYAMSMLGRALFGQNKPGEAEPFLAQGYEGLKARHDHIPSLLARHHIGEALQQLIQFYESTNQVEKAKSWRARTLPAGSGHGHDGHVPPSAGTRDPDPRVTRVSEPIERPR